MFDDLPFKEKLRRLQIIQRKRMKQYRKRIDKLRKLFQGMLFEDRF